MSTSVNTPGRWCRPNGREPLGHRSPAGPVAGAPKARRLRSVCAVICVFTGWIAGALAAPPPPDTAARTADLSAILNVDSCELVTINPGQTASGQLNIVVPIGGIPMTLTLEPRSVRADTFSVLVPLADGTMMPIEPLPPNTYRGTVEGLAGSNVAASMSPDGINARIILPNDTDYFLEPVAAHVAGATMNEYVMYRGDAVIPSGGTCGTSGAPAIGGTAGTASGTTSGTTAAGGVFIAELAIDTDFEFFVAHGSDLAATVAAIEETINAVNVQYEREVAIRHVITRIVIRDTEPDPYSTSDASALLTQVRNEWTSPQLLQQPRDMVQMFTGRNLNGSTIGIAFLATVCLRGSHYSVVQSGCCGSLACSTDLSAHELGHNWSALHCGDDGFGDPDPCSPGCSETMNCSLTCTNHFGTTSVDQIVAFRDTLPVPVCLDLGDELVRVIIDTTPAGLFNLNEGDVIPLTATAQFRFGANQDVTSVVPWSVDRPTIADVDPTGLLTTFNVDGDSCVTISTSFTSDGLTRAGQRTLVVTDLDAPRAIIDSVPPKGAIDARQTTLPNTTTPTGFKTIDLTFNGDVCLQVRTDFSVRELGGTSPVPFPAIRQVLSARDVRLTLTSTIEPGAWTEITEITSGANVRIGYLPGDVNADGLSEEADVATLADHLTGTIAPLPIRSTDIDRSTLTTPADLLRVIDLLNGADPSGKWLGQTLPP